MFSISQPAPPTGDPPKFGHDMLKEFAFDPDYINLNNGKFLCTPRLAQSRRETECPRILWIASKLCRKALCRHLSLHRGKSRPVHAP